MMRARWTGTIIVMTLFPLANSTAQQAPVVTDELRVDRPVERELAVGERHVYRLQLESGQYAQILVEPQEGLIEVTLTAPDGRLVSTHDNVTVAETLPAYAETAGEFGVAVARLIGDARVRYRLRIAELRVGGPRDRQRALAERSVAEATELFRKGTAESLKAALVRLEEAIEHARGAGDQRYEAETLTFLGGVHGRLGDPDDRNDKGHFTHASPGLRNTPCDRPPPQSRRHTATRLNTRRLCGRQAFRRGHASDGAVRRQ